MTDNSYSRQKSSSHDKEDGQKVKIYSMNVSRLPVNTSILGCVHEIKEYEISFILPGAVRAKLPITNISDQYSALLQEYTKAPTRTDCPKPRSMFVSGQLFPLRVVDKCESSVHFKDSALLLIDIEVSINPKDVLCDLSVATFLANCANLSIPAAVKSIEEHGYLMDIGFSDEISGFLSFEDAQTFISSHRFTKLTIGQVVFCHVLSSSKRIIKLTTKSPKAIKDVNRQEAFPINCLLPGLTLSATIVSTSPKGLEVVILSHLKGFVHRDHLKSIWDLPNKDYEIGSKVKGIVLFVNPVTKVVALSLRLRNEILNLRKIWSSVKVGEIIENAQLVGKDEVNNFIFKLPNELKGIAAKSQLTDEYLSDEDLAVLENRMPIGSFQTCRVKSISYIDGYIKLTLKPSLLEAKYISPDELNLGMIVEGTVKKFSKKGLIIRLGFGAKAFCPPIHFIDKKLPNPEKLFAAGAKIKCRIIRIDKKGLIPKIAVTCRPALVKKSLNILDQIDKAKQGFCTKGVIVLVQNNGILIEFFNELRGFLSIKRLKKEDIYYSESTYAVGQILTVYVVDSDKKSKHIHLSLQLEEDVDMGEGKKKLKKKHSESNDITACTMLENCLVARKDVDGLYLTHVSCESRELFLPRAHLSDFPGLTDDLMNCYEPGDKIDKLMVFKRARNLCILTRKSLIITAVEDNRQIFDVNSIHTDSVFPAVIKSFKSYGIIMEVPSNTIGLVPTLYTSKPAIDPLNSPYVLGQTLLVAVKGVKEDENGVKRLALSMLIKDCNSTTFNASKVLSIYLNECDIIHCKLKQINPDPVIDALKSHKMGDIIRFRVISSTNNEKTCDCVSPFSKKPLKGIIFEDQISPENKSIKIGSTGDGVILYPNLSERYLLLSPDEVLIKKVKSSIKNDSYNKVQRDQTLLAFVQLVAKQYILVSLQAHGIGAFAFMNRYEHLNSLQPVKHEYMVGDKVYIVVDLKEKLSSGQVLIVGHRSVTKAKENKLKQLTEKQKKKTDLAGNLSDKKRKEPVKSQNMSGSESDKDDDEDENNKIVKRRKQETSENAKDLKGKFYKKMQTSCDTKIKSALLDDEGFVWSSELPDRLANPNEEKLPQMTNSLANNNQLVELNKETIEKELTKEPGLVTNWLNYINYFLKEGDIAKAKECCKTALDRLDHQKEDDILKIWLMMIKIEIDHGNGESTQKLLKEALRANNEVKILQGMIKIYESQGKIELAEQIHREIIKRFHEDFHVWVDFGKYYLARGMKDAARDVFQRSIKAVDKCNHIELITKFAQIECQYGEIERAKSLLEAVLVNYSKRTDIWSTYIDMMIKYALKNNQTPENNLDFIRLLFERAISIKIKPKKISFLFQKYIEFEKNYGDERRIPEINRKALDYSQEKSSDL